MLIDVRSEAFGAGEVIPERHTADGADVSPALEWTGVPAGTVELALIVDDPDAPRSEPWVHWVVYGIPVGSLGLPEGVSGDPEALEGVGALKEGVNDFGDVGYGGPAPPRGHGVHHYHFRLYALDAALTAPSGLSKRELLAAMSGHILAGGELVGTYER